MTRERPPRWRRPRAEPVPVPVGFYAVVDAPSTPRLAAPRVPGLRCAPAEPARLRDAGAEPEPEAVLADLAVAGADTAWVLPYRRQRPAGERPPARDRFGDLRRDRTRSARPRRGAASPRSGIGSRPRALIPAQGSADPPRSSDPSRCSDPSRSSRSWGGGLERGELCTVLGSVERPLRRDDAPEVGQGDLHTGHLHTASVRQAEGPRTADSDHLRHDVDAARFGVRSRSWVTVGFPWSQAAAAPTSTKRTSCATSVRSARAGSKLTAWSTRPVRPVRPRPGARRSGGASRAVRRRSSRAGPTPTAAGPHWHPTSRPSPGWSPRRLRPLRGA